MDAPLTTRLETTPDAFRIELHGRIDRDGDAALAEAWAAASASDAALPVVLDFDSVGYINSTGIALIVRLLADARRVKREIRARGLSDHYREIFRITRLSDFMTIEDDIAGTATATATEPEGAAR